MTNRISLSKLSVCFRAALAVLLAIVVSAPVLAAVPQVLNYQGRLAGNTPEQEPITAVVSMEFRLYGSATGSDLLWSNTKPAVDVVDGLFSVMLGHSEPIPLSVFTNGQYLYLQLEVSGEILWPRQRIVSAAFARVAELAELASSAEDLVCDGCVTGVEIQDGSITGAEIQNASITGTQIQDASIGSADIANGSITGIDIADGTIVSGDIGNDEITGSHIQSGTVWGSDIRDNTITSDDIQDNTITTHDIHDGYIGGVDIGSGQIGSRHLNLSVVNYGPFSNQFDLERVHVLSSDAEFCALSQHTHANMVNNGTTIWCYVYYQSGAWKLSVRGNNTTTVSCAAICIEE